MSGIMSMFSNMMGSNAPAAPAPGATSGASTPGNIPPNSPNTGAASPNAAPNGALPGNENSNPAAAATPLDQFNDLWKTPESSANGQQAGIFGEVDPKKFMEAAGKIDFTKVITPEQLQSISAGGEDAVKAFASALNTVAQTTYAQSAFAATKITEQALNRARESFIAELPSHIKKQTVSENLRNENQVFSNPAVQPIISALEAQLAVKYPNASAGELTQMAKNYVEALGSSFSPKKPAEETAGNSRTETDWSEFLK